MTERFPTMVRDALALLAEHGYAADVTNGGKHLKVKWIDQAGHPRLLVVARSPSDRKAHLRSLAVLRRRLRN
jgi:hypothetical protein